MEGVAEAGGREGEGSHMAAAQMYETINQGESSWTARCGCRRVVPAGSELLHHPAAREKG